MNHLPIRTLLLLGLSAVASAQSSNVLLIIADDLAWHDVASFGGPLCCLCLVLLGLWPKRLRTVLVLLLLCGLAQLVGGGLL